MSLSGASGNTFISSTTVYINAQAGRSGSFQAAATSTDNDSGILKLNFPALSGFTSGGGDVSETLTNNNSCGAAGSGGPYTSPTTILGTNNAAITVGYCYRYTLTGTDNVGNTTSVSTTVKVPFAGIDWTNISTSNNKTVSCNYTTITAVSCSVSGVGSGGTFTAAVELIDANHNPVSNTTGSSITVTESTSGQGSSTGPTSVTIAQNAAASASTFTLTLSNGSGKTATITASITVNGTIYTVNCQVST